MDTEHSYTLCRHHLHRYVRVTTTEGKIYDGFIVDVNLENVILGIPTHEIEGADSHEFGLGPFSRHLTLPISVLASLFLLPFFGRAVPF
ncbi:hypothetical protein [Aneurinibacillus tyrosinisolvens]|uniref:hypothetical protein n=1 Tax=Aneurinibacillus tyrosinisolvens TaxID=1443435 RepID=UPI00063F7B6D|nr:hypothetical protein [Aneurinibacillus tyrosinisolvens]